MFDKGRHKTERWEGIGMKFQAGQIDVAVIGAPACVAFDERTALDKLLPFVFAGIEPGDLVRRWGVGGLCEHCPTCHYPACSFAAGS